MKIIPIILTNTFKDFFHSASAGGILLMVCTLFSFTIANTSFGLSYIAFWHTHIAGLSLEHWINDGLMAIFFLLIGLELERELYSGELSNLRNALLPIFAAIGGMMLPALIHLQFNANTPMQLGMGIPMATDIAFAMAILALLGDRVPASLKVFVVAFAVIDDLGAATIIALFYTAHLSMPYLLGAIGIWLCLVALNRLRVMKLLPYLLGGLLMWVLTLKSGVHATLAGIALAFAIPYSSRQEDETSPSHWLEHSLHQPVAFIVLPIFALANTCVVVDTHVFKEAFATHNVQGIVTGLAIGKPLGVTLLCWIAIKLGVCKLPSDMTWPHLIGAGLLGGIGFTMSIFITNLAFIGQADIINASKLGILVASIVAGIAAYSWLHWVALPKAHKRSDFR